MIPAMGGIPTGRFERTRSMRAMAIDVAGRVRERTHQDPLLALVVTAVAGCILGRILSRRAR